MIGLLIWLRLLSPHFEVLTNAGDKLGREAVQRLEEIHAAFAPGASVLPVRVYLFRSGSDLKPYRTADTTSGFFQSGPERNLIVIGYAGPETYRVVFHEYVHLVMNHTRARMPQWFEEGTAEFYSTLEVTGGKLRVGRAIPMHVGLLRAGEWLDAGTLFGVTKDSPYYSERGKVGVFYAQSWALVHMLNLAPGYREGMARFAQGASFEEAFGKTPEAALRDLKEYIAAGRFRFVDLEYGERAGRVDIPAEPLEETDARLALAALLMETGKLKEAGQAYRKLARENPDHAGIETALGGLALRQRDHKQARQHLRRAIELGSRQAATYFEYAMLLRESGGDQGEVAANLRRATELNPNFAEAHFLLGLMFTYQKRDAEAIPHFERAAAILPRQSYFWHALALARQRTGDAAEARRAAARALENAVNRNEADMAQAALRLAEQAPPAAPAARPAVTTPPGWSAPKGDARVEGTLRRIDCFGATARLFIETPGRHVALMITNPGEVLLRSASAITFQFTCGPQKPVKVEVEYATRPDSLRGTAGEVTAIEFR